MTVLDADLVRRWFGRLRAPDPSVTAFWGLQPTVQELAAFDEGGTVLEYAVCDLPPSASVVELTEMPAGLLLNYLRGMAAGVGETRRLLGSQGLTDGLLDPPGEDGTGALALAAGLNAAAAALPDRAGDPSRATSGTGPTAAESARSAGVAAAELVVDGADITRIAASAASSAVTGWRSAVPQDPDDRIDRRTKGLVGMVLVALQLECRDPGPPAHPAACGALPGENRGRAFLAEITFTMHTEGESMATLAWELSRLCRDVAIWPAAPWPQFHLHTDRPGEVIEQVYASGVPFDLQITRLG